MSMPPSGSNQKGWPAEHPRRQALEWVRRLGQAYFGATAASGMPVDNRRPEAAERSSPDNASAKVTACSAKSPSMGSLVAAPCSSSAYSLCGRALWSAPSSCSKR